VFSRTVRVFRCPKSLGVILALLCIPAVSIYAAGQQTLGSINGTVTDASGAVVPGATVKARAVATNLSVEAKTKSDGSFDIADLPIGTYEVSFLKDGFDTIVYSQIVVQGKPHQYSQH